jgi:hypothetical protein
MRKLVGLLVAVAACGDDGVHHLADAPVRNDAAIDGSMIDAMPLPVSLTVTHNGSPRVGVKVYFQAADSTEISSTTTDASGVASAMMPHGGFVTALDPAPPQVLTLSEQHDLKTFANVKPGDHLTLTSNDLPVVMTVTVNIAADPANPTYYEIYSTCGGNSTELYNPPAGSAFVAAAVTTTMYLYNCSQQASDFLVISEDVDHIPLNTFVVPGVVVANGGTIDLTGGTYAGMTSHDFKVSNLPVPFTSLSYYLDYAVPAGVFFPDISTNVGTTAGAATATLYTPPVATGTQVERIELDANAGSQQLYRWGATPAGDGSYAWDLATVPLLGFTTFPAYDPPTNQVTWSTGASGATPDFYKLGFFNQRATDNGSAGTDYLNVTWSIVGAFDGPTVTLPTLPADAAVFNSVAGDSPQVQGLLAGRVPGGYDAIRAHGFSLFDNSQDPTVAITGTTGHFELETAHRLGFQAPARTHAKRR